MGIILKLIPVIYLWKYIYLELQSNENIVINEIETEGVYLKDNLLSNARVYHNGENIDAAGMVDNNVSSYYKTTYSDSDEYILDFFTTDNYN